MFLSRVRDGPTERCLTQRLEGREHSNNTLVIMGVCFPPTGHNVQQCASVLLLSLRNKFGAL